MARCRVKNERAALRQALPDLSDEEVQWAVCMVRV
jgi:hypothetical protein